MPKFKLNTTLFIETETAIDAQREFARIVVDSLSDPNLGDTYRDVLVVPGQEPTGHVVDDDGGGMYPIAGTIRVQRILP
jgi:hypothetical protein